MPAVPTWLPVVHKSRSHPLFTPAVLTRPRRLLLSADVAGDPTTRALFAVDLRRSPQTLLPAVVSALECHRAAPLAPLCHLQRAQAMLLQPSGDSDHEIAFGAGLALGVDVVADISNVVAVHRIRVKVTKIKFKSSPLILVQLTLTVATVQKMMHAKVSIHR